MLDDMIGPVDPAVLEHPSVDELVAGQRTIIDAIDPDAPSLRLVHDGIHGLRELSRVLHESGAGAPTQQGTVVQLSTSAGGVPKSAVPSADIGRRGLIGDRQSDRKHHGRPFQAVCLWSSELIDALAAEGHPVRAGATGENVTIGGIDWATLRPGVQILAGQVLFELSAWAEPCRKNDQWFTGRSDRIDHRRHPGWSRIYAWVLEPGTVTTGDPVTVEP